MVGVTAARTGENDAQVQTATKARLNAVVADEGRPVADVFDYVGDQVVGLSGTACHHLRSGPQRSATLFLIGQHKPKREGLAERAARSHF